MSDLRAAAEQALDTLEHVQAHIGRYDPPVVTTIARAMQPTIDALRAVLAAEQPQSEAQPVAWREHVEQRIRSWRQRTMNRYGDRLAIDDYMSADAIDDLVDYVCDEYAAPPPSAPEPSANERRLRRLLCIVKHGRSAYMDDGEAQDSSAHPSIDYLRDSLDEIEAKWRQRASAPPPTPEPSEAEVAAAMASLYRAMEPAAWPSEDEVTDALRAAAAARNNHPA